MKYLLLALVIIVVYSVFKGYKIRTRRRPPPSAAGEDMVRCAQCGVHLPRSESLLSDQAFYCSPEHRRLRESAQ